MINPKQAEKIQREIYYNLSDTQKIGVVSDFYLLVEKLKNLTPVLNKKSKGVMDQIGTLEELIAQIKAEK